MPEAQSLNLLLIALLTGGLGVALVNRFFATRDSKRKKAEGERQEIDAASVRFFELQFGQISKDRDDLREELRDNRAENRRLNDKIDTQAAEFYELKGKYDAGQDHLERLTAEYFSLLQKYTAVLLEVEVLRATLKDHGIDMPNVATLVATHHKAESEVKP